MNKNHSPYIYIYIVLAFMLLIASCDKPQSENKATSSSSVDTENTKPKPPIHTFTFSRAFPRIALAANNYTQAVTEAHKLTDDTRETTYSSSNDDIATVDDKGVVTFKTAGTVTIKAEKQKKGEHVLRSAQYTLYITIQPENRVALSAEIKRATAAHGGTVDLNYIDTSAITTMNSVFYDKTTFNGDISKWNVSEVTDMSYMFQGAVAFNGDISEWDVSKVTIMQSMFDGATAFNQNLESWGEKLHTDIKANDMRNAYDMFQNSGVAASVPPWCTGSCSP